MCFNSTNSYVNWLVRMDFVIGLSNLYQFYRILLISVEKKQ